MARINNLHKKLNMIESRLQTLVEGSTARLLPSKNNHDTLPLRLISAMKSGIQINPDGTLLAPNIYSLTIHPEDASIYLENRLFLDEITQAIFQSGTEAGLTFIAPPIIKIKTDPQLNQHQLTIQAETRLEKPGETTTIAIDINGEGEKFPIGAFLLVGGKHVHPLTEPVVNIGRRVDNHLAIDDKRVSRLHAQLRIIDDKYVIFDLDSTGGTFVNDNVIQQHALETGDVISLAGVPLIYGQDEAFSPESSKDSIESEPDSTRPLRLVPDDENSKN